MNAFEYARPQSLEDALALLGDSWGEAEILAGGADLVTALKQHLVEPKRVVSLRDIPGLSGVEKGANGFRIGAMTSLAALLEDAALCAAFPSMASAIQGVGSRQMITQGTLGGDLCQRPRCWYFRTGHGLLAVENGTPLVENGDNRYHAIFGNAGAAKFVSVSSLAPALIALEATFTAVGPGGKTREIAASDFFHTPQTGEERETVLAPNEILTHIALPDRGRKNATYEVRHRHGLDWPYATASVAFDYEGGRATGVRVVLGHVAPVPWVAGAAAAAIEGKAIDPASAVACGEAAVMGATPLSGNGYKVQLARTAVKRAVLAAAGIPLEVS